MPEEQAFCAMCRAAACQQFNTVWRRCSKPIITIKIHVDLMAPRLPARDLRSLCSIGRGK